MNIHTVHTYIRLNTMHRWGGFGLYYTKLVWIGWHRRMNLYSKIQSNKIVEKNIVDNID